MYSFIVQPSCPRKVSMVHIQASPHFWDNLLQKSEGPCGYPVWRIANFVWNCWWSEWAFLLLRHWIAGSFLYAPSKDSVQLFYFSYSPNPYFCIHIYYVCVQWKCLLPCVLHVIFSRLIPLYNLKHVRLYSCLLNYLYLVLWNMIYLAKFISRYLINQILYAVWFIFQQLQM